MGFYLEYTEATAKEDGFALPPGDAHAGDPLPVRAPSGAGQGMPVRASVPGANLEGAKTEAEQILSRSRTAEARLFEDPDDSASTGSGRLVARFSRDTGWAGP